MASLCKAGRQSVVEQLERVCVWSAWSLLELRVIGVELKLRTVRVRVGAW